MVIWMDRLWLKIHISHRSHDLQRYGAHVTGPLHDFLLVEKNYWVTSGRMEDSRWINHSENGKLNGDNDGKCLWILDSIFRETSRMLGPRSDTEIPLEAKQLHQSNAHDYMGRKRLQFWSISQWRTISSWLVRHFSHVKYPQQKPTGHGFLSPIHRWFSHDIHLLRGFPHVFPLLRASYSDRPSSERKSS